MKVLASGLLILVLSACASTPAMRNRALFDHLSFSLTNQYHECIPLGWAPVPTAGTYYPGYTATLASYHEFLDAVWRGRIETGELRKPDALAVFDVLNHLVRVGMLVRSPRGAGYDYFLTWRAIQYYFGSSNYNNNHGSLPYLCYSTIVPDRILWVQRLSGAQSEGVTRGLLYRVSFSWKASAPADWANDKILRSHSVILAPVDNPVIAKLWYYKGRWSLLNIYDRS